MTDDFHALTSALGGRPTRRPPATRSVAVGQRDAKGRPTVLHITAQKTPLPIYAGDLHVGEVDADGYTRWGETLGRGKVIDADKDGLDRQIDAAVRAVDRGHVYAECNARGVPTIVRLGKKPPKRD